MVTCRRPVAETATRICVGVRKDVVHTCRGHILISNIQNAFVPILDITMKEAILKCSIYGRIARISPHSTLEVP